MSLDRDLCSGVLASLFNGVFLTGGRINFIVLLSFTTGLWYFLMTFGCTTTWFFVTGVDGSLGGSAGSTGFLSCGGMGKEVVLL